MITGQMLFASAFCFTGVESFCQQIVKRNVIFIKYIVIVFRGKTCKIEIAVVVKRVN